MNFLALNKAPVNETEFQQVIVSAVGAGAIASSKLQGFADLGLVTTDDFDGYDATLYTTNGAEQTPMTRWQGTLNSDGVKFVQATFRTDDGSTFGRLQSATYIEIYKLARIGSDEVRELLFAMPIDTVQTYDSSVGYTVILRGTDTDAVFEETLSTKPIQLRNVRRVTRSNASIAARCEINFASAPNYYYTANGNTFQASYVNFYANDRDAYMDIGRRG